MATNFPTSLDSLTNPATSDRLNNPSHAVQHANANDAIEALQARVGVTNSDVTTSHEYRITQVEATAGSGSSGSKSIFQDVRNQSGSSLIKGTPVYVSGSDGASGKLLISPSSNSTEATSSKTMGLTSSTIADNNNGQVISEGILEGIDTTGASDGDPVWLGTSGAKIFGLANKPYAPSHLVFLGVVIRGGQQNTGSMYVKIQNGFELEELHNVQITSPVNGAGIIYDATAGYWKDSDALATQSYVGTQINNLINSAPGTLDTLGEIATALAADESALSALTTTVNNKAPINSPTFTGTVTLPTGTVTSEMILDGTIVNADINSSAAISLSKLATDPLARANHTGTQTASTISDFNESAQDAVGGILGSGLTYTDSSNTITVDPLIIQLRVANVSDTEIGYLDGVTSSIQTQLNTKSPLDSPTFTGVPLAPTATTGTNTTQIATTAFVKTAVDSSLSGTSPSFVDVTTTGYLKTQQVEEAFTSYSSSISAAAVVSLDCSSGNIFDISSTVSGNWTANFTNLSLDSGYATNVTILIRQGATAYIPNALQIGGSAQTINWQGGAAPTPNANKKDALAFTFFNSGGTYTVFGQLVTYG